MPNKSSDAVFQLVKTLDKAEKRNFKRYVQRNSDSADLKTVVLFDALDRMERYDEQTLAKRMKGVLRSQISNLKAQLQREILNSLRLLHAERSIDLQLQELLAHARILYNKGLYQQSLQSLERVRTVGSTAQQSSYIQQALFLEKKIEALHITRAMTNRAQDLALLTEQTERSLILINQFSNLSLQLYSRYITHGLARSAADEAGIIRFFDLARPQTPLPADNFYAQLYAFQSYCWYGFIRQDFLLYYRYASKWAALFERFPQMQQHETIHYIKALHNLLTASFSLRHHVRFDKALAALEEFCETDLVRRDPNTDIQAFIYRSIARINQQFNQGSFREGTAIVPGIEAQLSRFGAAIDEHRHLIFYYKFACLYFGCGDYDTAIDYLARIINSKIILRTDIHCYARLLHLIAHFELGNAGLISYLIRSVYRFMARMDNLQGVEEAVFRFLRRTGELNTRNLKRAFSGLLAELNAMGGNRFETRAFVYLDIISWLESRIEGSAVDAIIRRKYAATTRRRGAGM